MKIALLALTALLPSLASADDASPAPYVLHEGRAVRSGQAAPGGAQPAAEPGGGAAPSNTVAVRQVSAFGTSTIHAGVSGGRPAVSRPAVRGSRAFRGSSGHRGIVGAAGTGAPTSTPSSSNDAPPPYAVPGAKIISAGQPPVYSEAAGGGTHSVEGGGFIAMDQAKARDVGRAPGISWAPPDTPPSVNPVNSGRGGGTGASANGPAPSGAGGGSNAPVNTPPTSGKGSGGETDSATGFNPAF